MGLSRRDLAVAGALALGTMPLIGRALAAEGGDEAAVKKAVEEFRTAYIKQDKAQLEAMTRRSSPTATRTGASRTRPNSSRA